MFLELGNGPYKEELFKKTYLDILKSRLTLGSLELENITTNYANAKQVINMYGQYEALNYAFSKENSIMSHFEFLGYLCDIVEKISNGEIYNFRRIPIQVNGSNVKRTKPEMIRNDLLYLIDDYNYQIEEYNNKKNNYENNEDELFSIEASFHVRLLHIHPFEDYNGRVSRIILAHHLCSQSCAPCIITKETKSEYCKYIENGDVNGLAKFFKRLSEKELQNMLIIYKKLDEEGNIKSNKMTTDEQEEYNEIIKRGYN